MKQSALREASSPTQKEQRNIDAVHTWDDRVQRDRVEKFICWLQHFKKFIAFGFDLDSLI